MTFHWSEMMTFSQYCSAVRAARRSSSTPLTLIQHSAAANGWRVTLLFFSLIWGRMAELFCPGPINPHWGVLTKCLAYSKAASDPFVYSLLRHQYRKTCSLLANKILRRSPLNSSSNTSNANATSDLQAPVTKTVGQWGGKKARCLWWAVTRTSVSIYSVTQNNMWWSYSKKSQIKWNALWMPHVPSWRGGMWQSGTLQCFWMTLEVGSDFGNTGD